MRPSQSIVVPVDEACRLAAQPRHRVTDVDALPEARQRQGAANTLRELSVGREAREVFGVGDGPGEAAVTLMPSTPHSSARQRVSISTPAFAEQAWACVAWRDRLGGR
jgi:hypothetical protein